jgi:hypothetical protein
VNNKKKQKELEKLAKQLASTKLASKEWQKLVDKIDKILGIEYAEPDSELDEEWERQNKS